MPMALTYHRIPPLPLNINLEPTDSTSARPPPPAAHASKSDEPTTHPSSPPNDPLPPLTRGHPVHHDQDEDEKQHGLVHSKSSSAHFSPPKTKSPVESMIASSLVENTITTCCIHSP